MKVTEPFVELIETIFFCLLARTCSANDSDTSNGPRTLTAMIVSNSS